MSRLDLYAREALPQHVFAEIYIQPQRFLRALASRPAALCTRRAMRAIRRPTSLSLSLSLSLYVPLSLSLSMEENDFLPLKKTNRDSVKRRKKKKTIFLFLNGNLF
jgi:hypothetical protein